MVCKRKIARLSGQIINHKMPRAIGKAEPLGVGGNLRVVTEPLGFPLSGQAGIQKHAVQIICNDDPLSGRFHALRREGIFSGVNDGPADRRTILSRPASSSSLRK